MEIFDEDAAVCRLAERIGMSVNRVESMKVTDEAALKRQGFMRQTPDYSKIRKAMNAGVPVYGVERGDMEYIFRRIKGGLDASKDTNDSEEKLLAEDTPI